MQTNIQQNLIILQLCEATDEDINCFYLLSVLACDAPDDEIYCRGCYGKKFGAKVHTNLYKLFKRGGESS